MGTIMTVSPQVSSSRWDRPARLLHRKTRGVSRPDLTGFRIISSGSDGERASSLA